MQDAVVPLMAVVVILGVVVVALTALASLQPSNMSAQRREVERTPATAIGTLTQDDRVVRIVGTAVQLPGSDEFVTGPYSGRPGLAIVYERYALGRRHQRMELLDRQVRHTPFAIEDASGTIDLDLTHARFALDMAPAELAQDGPNRVFGADIIASNQWESQDHDEGGIVPGNQLTVTGRVKRRADGTLVLAGTAADPVVVVALPSS